MKYNQLNTTKHKTAKRLGRGIASGQGKTAGRGTKGQRSRAGSRKKPGFAGGQNPLMQQLPKLPGFKSHRIAPETVYTGQLASLSETNIDARVLADNKLISNPYVRVKLINKGELKKKLQVSLSGASSSAIEAIQAAGGQFIKVDRIAREAKQTDR